MRFLFTEHFRERKDSLVAIVESPLLVLLGSRHPQMPLPVPYRMFFVE